jgi:hypothetical protein
MWWWFYINDENSGNEASLQWGARCEDCIKN